jgi:hypothetical protein
MIRVGLMQTIVHVIATTFDGTRAALAAAVPLARGSNGRLVVLVPHVVTSADDMEGPPESTALMAACYEHMVRDLGAQAEIEICASIGLEELVAKVHDAQSLVVVGGPLGRWLTSPEERFANRLTLAGCQVILAAAGANATQRRVAA